MTAETEQEFPLRIAPGKQCFQSVPARLDQLIGPFGSLIHQNSLLLEQKGQQLLPRFVKVHRHLFGGIVQWIAPRHGAQHHQGTT